MTLTKRRSGERVRALPTRDWNEFVGAATWVNSHQDSLETSGSGLRFTERIANDSCILLAPFEVVGLDALKNVQDEDNIKFSRTWSGVIPTADHFGLFAVVQNKTEIGGHVSSAVFLGLTPVLVNILNVNHQYADIEDGSVSRLESGWVGSARILFKKTELLGDNLCLVIAGMEPHVEYRATPQGNIAAGASGTFDIEGYAGDVEVDDVKHNWMTGGKQLDLGTESIIRYFWHESEWRVVEAACP